jgi:hypothetical protein
MTAKRLAKAKKAGRPPTLTMPEPIDDTPENVAQAILNTKPKKRDQWKFMQRKGAAPVSVAQPAANRESSA